MPWEIMAGKLVGREKMTEQNGQRDTQKHQERTRKGREGGKHR